MTPEEKRKRILELNLRMKAKRESEANKKSEVVTAGTKKSPTDSMENKKMPRFPPTKAGMLARIAFDKEERAKDIASGKAAKDKERAQKGVRVLSAMLDRKKATAKRRIAKALLARVMMKRANKKNPFQDILDDWDIGDDEGFDDGFNPLEGVDELEGRVKDGKKSAVMLQANYSYYGGTGSGGGAFLDGLKEAYARAKPSFGLKFTNVNHSIKWGNKKSVIKALYNGNLSSLADNLENRDDDDEDAFDEPTYYGRTKIEVMFDTPEKKTEAIAFFAKLSDRKD